MKFEVKKQYTASVGDIDVLVEVCSFVFNFTDIWIEKIEDNKVIFKLIMIGYMVNHLNQHMLVLFRSNSFQSLIQLIILVLEWQLLLPNQTCKALEFVNQQDKELKTFSD